MNFQIKNRFTGEVQFECELSAEVAGRSYSLQLGFAVKKAIEARANLACANLARANLAGANLARANLAGANLARANLARANLACANLARANLAGANLARANLAGANLARANLARANLARAKLGNGLTLVGARPYLAIGPIGSEAGTLEVFLTDHGVYLKRGCFFGTREEFAEAVQTTHGVNIHGDVYAAALALVDAHATAWMPANTDNGEVAA